MIRTVVLRYLQRAYRTTGVMNRAIQQERSIDSSFDDKNHPAVIYPLQDWLKGASSDV